MQNWQLINSGMNQSTHRLNVIGGWLVKYEYLDEQGSVCSMAFVADPDHEWKIERCIR
ncbi:hypothetical protein [Methanococcus maripaludis]|uniref:Uncharacterized protein n=1 Tax=Methanococcus maripaludis TaxID=39152 RepID=A0A7J9PMJ3_METMI|nr:hypothetical protein [Methanococcus maripaludis]MBA2864452.1 hypothetical protein [Methanococcus maripaludis]